MNLRTMSHPLAFVIALGTACSGRVDLGDSDNPPQLRDQPSDPKPAHAGAITGLKAANSSSSSSSSSSMSASMQAAADCDELAMKVEQTFTTFCSGCHA